MAVSKKDVIIHVRVNDDTKKKLQELSDLERRKFSDFIRMKLEDIANAEQGIPQPTQISTT